jgi:hypothetical protein
MLVWTAQSLKAVALACAAVADHLNDPGDDQPYILKKLTLPGGAGGVRFMQVVEVNGERVEVTVRTLK